ncbi:MAG: hypothetical protein LBH70_09870 [Spirochaetaceae bacterium]|nr:hypothetical protein [Spirochaetaceae bacterium]
MRTYYAEAITAARDTLFNICLPKNVSVGLGGSETPGAMNILLWDTPSK